MGQLNPTRQEILAAYDALDDLLIYAKSYEQESGFNRVKLQALAQELRQDIENALPPIPHPTMEDIEWDDDKHFLAEAEHSEYGKVAMVSKTHDTEEIYYLRWGATGRLMALDSPDKLTPTGHRYVLQDEE